MFLIVLKNVFYIENLEMVGIEGFEPSLLVPQTSMLKNQYIIYPITFQRDRTWTCNHLHPKQEFYHLNYSLINSEDRGLAPQTFTCSHYLAGRFWTFQIYLPYILYIKKSQVSCLDYLEILNKESWFIYCQNSIFIQDSLMLWWQLGVTNKIFILYIH